jgi:hypothetical protein
VDYAGHDPINMLAGYEEAELVAAAACARFL